jgi:hypothetical protein
LNAQEAEPAAGPPAATSPVRREPAPEIKPYDKVITKEPKSDAGIFTIHELKGKVYYEIPVAALGKDFLASLRLQRPRPALATEDSSSGTV